MKTGIVFSAVVAGTVLASGAAAAQRTLNERVATSPTGTVEVHNVAGSVRVSAWDRNEVQVTGSLGRGAERLELDEQGGGRVVVRVVLPRNAHNVRGSDLEVRVPARKSVTVRAVSADVEVSGVSGAVNAQSVSGKVDVSGSPSDVSAQSRSGNVVLDVESGHAEANSTSGGVTVRGRIRGAVEVASVSGNVNVAASTGEVKASSVSGGVHVAAMTGRAEVSSVSGNIRLTGRRIAGNFHTVSGEIVVRGDLASGGTTSLQSHSGGVELYLGSGADLEVTTFSGEILNEVNARLVRSNASRREQHLVVGGGGPRVTVRTFSGDVKLAR
ncbi:MAG TPA: DUF4097 family beta strand repeat-containing protein [Longimicrobiaceae bacterium]|nr:DUF4097 family beta strand repeat-containing protein [Longimicrobiaceae bacterium]